jgi:soluble lytic murein transglycosylase-like protein
VSATPTPTPTVDPVEAQRIADEQAAQARVAEQRKQRAERRAKRAERRAKARERARKARLERQRECSNRDQRTVINCIKQAAARWNVSSDMLLRKARCESTLNPRAVGFGIHRGLFQFNYPGTWNTTPYAKYDPFEAKWNALAAAWAHHVGRGGEWQCQ